MNRRGRAVFFFLICLSFQCASAPKTFHHLSLENQTITIDGSRYYRLGTLPPDWEVRQKEGPSISFRNKKSGALIATEAFCDVLFEDLPLHVLTGHLFAGLEGFHLLSEEEWSLDGREALHTRAGARVDGREVLLETVVTKKNGCHFDFFGVSTKQKASSLQKDFIRLVKGFSFP